MKRAGFTMIELIFVIVILGILAAVALPRFIGVSEQAEAGKCQAFVGTLNRTVGPALWSNSLLNGGGGLIDSSDGTARTAAQIRTAIETQIEIPDECLPSAADTTAYGQNFNLVIGSKNYDVNFTDGNSTSAPLWSWSQQ